MSTQVTYETDHISCAVIQRCQVHQIFVFCVFYCNLKEKDHIRRNKNNKKRNVCM